MGSRIGARRYIVYDRDKALGTYFTKEIVKMLNIPAGYIRFYERKGYILYGRYSFYRALEWEETVGLRKEWDKCRLRILAAGR